MDEANDLQIHVTLLFIICDSLKENIENGLFNNNININN